MNCNNDIKLNGKVAIITGGAQGMGFAIADMLAANGVKVAIFDINFESAEKAALKISEKGNCASAHKVDIIDEEEVTKTVETITDDYGILIFWSTMPEFCVRLE